MRLILLQHCKFVAQSRGADPSIKTEDYDPYLDPGRKLPIEVAIEDESIRSQLSTLQVMQFCPTSSNTPCA